MRRTNRNVAHLAAVLCLLVTACDSRTGRENTRGSPEGALTAPTKQLTLASARGAISAADATLTLTGARAVLAGALAKARALGTTGTIAISDETGHLVVLERIDGTFIAGDRVSTGKARTAALFWKPTRVFEDIIVQGRAPMLKTDGFTSMQGRVLIVVAGNVVGAIGVSGAARAAQDEELALAGAAVLASKTDQDGG